MLPPSPRHCRGGRAFADRPLARPRKTAASDPWSERAARGWKRRVATRDSPPRAAGPPVPQKPMQAFCRRIRGGMRVSQIASTESGPSTLARARISSSASCGPGVESPRKTGSSKLSSTSSADGEWTLRYTGMGYSSAASHPPSSRVGSPHSSVSREAATLSIRSYSSLSRWTQRRCASSAGVMEETRAPRSLCGRLFLP
mmetsp:Transcript_30409/g.51989  ORF Transcript_30409/g.51989 Transcript_30409/m.51989 type:complete len:200 (-) Transcript_30409:11-610(-)